MQALHLDGKTRVEAATYWVFLQKNHPNPFNHNLSHTSVGDKIYFDGHF